MNRFIFDVDGTLTPSRQGIDKKFAVWFRQFCKTNDVYLVTGSDYAKTVEQIGEQLCCSVNRIYNCSGSDVWEKGENIRTSSWEPDERLFDLMYGWLEASRFPLRMGNHIEKRPGMVNFSIVGRNAKSKERAEYVKWDLENRERESIAYQINYEFENITATVGGDTGIDIHPTGADKSQIIKDFDKADSLYFFGDRMDKGGNDYPLAKVVSNPKAVKNWKHTWEYLSWLQEQGIAK